MSLRYCSSFCRTYTVFLIDKGRKQLYFQAVTAPLSVCLSAFISCPESYIVLLVKRFFTWATSSSVALLAGT